MSFLLSSLFPLSAPRHIPDLTSDLLILTAEEDKRTSGFTLCAQSSPTHVFHCFLPGEENTCFLSKAHFTNITINVHDSYQNVPFHSKLSCVKVVEMRN